MLLVFSVLSIFLLDESLKETQWIEHRRKIETEIEGILASIHEMEATKRGYIITRDKRVYSTYYAAESNLFAHIDSAKALTKDVQVGKSLDSVANLVQVRLDLLEDIDSLFSASGEIDAPIRRKIVDGDRLMDEMQWITKDMLVRQKELMSKRISNLTLQRGSVFASIILFAIISIFVISGGFLRLRKDRRALERSHDENKLLLDEIKEREIRYRSLNDSSNDGIIIMDEGQHILSWNKAAGRIFGYTESEIIGNTLQFIVAKDELHFISDAMHDVRAAKDERPADERIKLSGLHKDGSRVPLEFTLAHWTHDHRLYFSGNIRDITKFEQAERELAQAEQFNLSARMARIIAHEVRNPLSNITLASDFILEGDVEEGSDLHVNAAIIARNAKRISNLIDGLLNSTKSTDLKIEPFTPTEILEIALNACRDRLTLKGVGVDTRGCQTDAKMQGDREKMVIVLVNIITNAIEAMDGVDEPRLTASCDCENDQIRLTIADNGKGMEPETLKKLFTPFFTSRHGGMGLGLSAVNHLVKQHKGKIEVESELGKGTTFHLLFPA